MHEEVSVLLLSVGESPGDLKVELERLGVSVLECDFLDAEEKIVDEAPDLVVLLGSRGAMELATLLDDQEGEHRPRMVIVAARKDLARLRGLNREVVISLFALETTEKVVGQRVESLARRAARRRSQAGAPVVPAAKATSLGLPSAQAILGHLNLKRAAAPSPPGISIREPEELDSARDKGPQSLSPIASPKLASPRQHAQDDDVVLDEDLLSLPPSQPPEGSSEIPQMPATPGLPAIELSGDTGPESSGAASSSPVSIPPTLPPQAKEQSAAREPGADKSAARPSLTKARKSVDEDELDISDAEKALENLDSSKAEITASLLKDAQDYLAEAKLAASPSKAAGPAENAPTQISEAEAPVAEEAKEDDGAAEVEAAIDNLGSPALMQESGTNPAGPGPNPPKPSELDPGAPSVPADEAQRISSEMPVHLHELPDEEKPQAAAEPPADREVDQDTGPAVEAGARAGEGDATLEGDAPHEEHSSQHAAPEAVAAPRKADFVQGSLEPSVAPHLAPPSSAKSSRGGWGLLLVAAAALGLGGAYYFKLFSPSPRPATQEAASPAASEPDASQAATTAPPADGAGVDAPSVAGPHEPEPAATTSDVAGGEEPEGGTEAQAALPGDNPFLVVDAAEPACETLVAAEKSPAEKDPVYQASVVWQEARELIVAGKLKDANIKMCEAVALNPESAAVEGLAALYLRLKSPGQALRWADRAEQLRPGQSEMGYVRGDIYSLLGRNDEARAIWLKTLNIPEQDLARIEAVSRDYSVEAGRHLRRGDLVRADQWFRRAVTLDPKNVAGIIGLAKTFYRAGDTAHARAFCEMSLSVSDEIPEVHVMLGEIALADGDKEGARVRFERALAVRPDFFPAKRGLSQVK